MDLWEPLHSRRSGRHRLTSVEVTVTNRCNMRCRHCAVGDSLSSSDPDRLSLDLIRKRLDEVEHLTTLSLTGGEPSESIKTLREFVLPLLRYARERGVSTQVNTNLTYDLERYQMIAPWVDLFHISWNYTGVQDFHRIAWGHGRSQVPLKSSALLFERMMENARQLSDSGSFLSAETMLNPQTAPFIGQMNRMIAELGCRRHEVHPMYSVDWARELPVLSLEQFRATVVRLLEERDPMLWVLFGTFPFLPCSPLEEDRALIRRVRAEPNVTVRNCPDGRNRVNINPFTGDVFVTDFAEVPALGNLQTDRLEQLFARWQEDPRFAPYNCYCEEAGCTGPNLIVAHMYYPGVDFRQRRALV